MLIQLENISKTYARDPKGQTVLHQIDLAIDAGECVAIMGASGSGKSTLMNLMGLLDTPTQGKYLWQNTDTTTLADHERARLRNQHCGFIFQQFHLLPRFDALYNVCLPLLYGGIPLDEAQEQAQKILQAVEMAEHAHKKTNQLSGGQQQRVAIARALVGSPELILADEPTGALDSKTGQAIMDLLLEQNRVRGAAVVIVTHDAGIAAQCSRLVSLHDGRIM